MPTHVESSRGADDARARRPGIRAASALVSVLVVAFTLSVGGVVLLVLLATSLRTGAEESVRVRATEAALLVVEQGAGALDDPAARHLTAAGPLQLVDPAREGAEAVVFSSFSSWDTPLSPLVPAPGQVQVRTPVAVPQADDAFSLVAQGLVLDGQPYVLLVAGRMSWVDDVLRLDAALTLLAVPVLSLLSGWAVWILVGRTLRPVEQIRTTVEEIGATDLATRVPVPPADDEIGRLAATMNAMLDRIEQAQRSQQRFVADASHELRSPVAAIGAGLEIVSARPEEAPQVLPLLETETRRLGQLTDGLLLLARADAGTLRHRRVDVDVDDLVDAEAIRLRSSQDLRVETHLEAGRVLGDPDELHRALRNLVDNAVRHARSRIGLTVSRIDGEVVLHVDDDGPGIPEADRERVFERFTRLDAARGRSYGGAGLGLAIVDGIVTAHGGEVTAGESPWAGARFTVRLPAAG